MNTPERLEIRKEALARQGTIINGRSARYLIEGDQSKARFQMGEEGLVHLAVEQGSGVKHRIKFFWEPDDVRLERSRRLVQTGLSDKTNSIDVLAGAPFALLDSIGGRSRFALIMRNVEGRSWKDLREGAENAGIYPPSDWPSFDIRLRWAYGLASAVQKMESLGFIHADVSDGNVLVVPGGQGAGQIALVDFDAYFNPTFPSKYRGTSGFVAPEIWNSGSVGKGSDRVAMALLIQEFLLTGHPDLNAKESFERRYSQHQVCSLESTAHPFLKYQFPGVAELLEETLNSFHRNGRPTPETWRDTLRPLYGQQSPRKVVVTSIPGNASVQLEIKPGWKKNLLATSSGIRADLRLTEAGSLRILSHPAAEVRMEVSEGTWVAVDNASEVALPSGAIVSDNRGKQQVRITVEKSSQETTESPVGLSLTAFDTQLWPTINVPSTRMQRFFVQHRLRNAGFVLLAIIVAILLILLAGYVLRPATRPFQTSSFQPIIRIERQQSNSFYPVDEVSLIGIRFDGTGEAVLPLCASSGFGHRSKCAKRSVLQLGV